MSEPAAVPEPLVSAGWIWLRRQVPADAGPLVPGRGALPLDPAQLRSDAQGDVLELWADAPTTRIADARFGVLGKSFGA